MGFFRNLLYEQYFLSSAEPAAAFACKTAIVTGANSGLGKEAARHLARLKCARLILGVRNLEAGEVARREIVSTTGIPESSVQTWAVDLSSFASVQAFAERANRELDRLDVLICNAGINTFKYGEFEGYEKMLTVNVLSTYLMAKLFLPLLERTAGLIPVQGDPDPRPPHLTIVGSDTLLMGSAAELQESPDKMFASMATNCQSSASRFRQQYGTTKLLILLLCRDLVYRQRSSGPSTGVQAVEHPERKCPVIINVANPGMCRSNLVHEVGGVARVMNVVLHARSAEMGGGAIVNCASAGWETNGQFVSSDKVHMASELSWDRALGEKLCKAAEQAFAKAEESGR